MNAADSSRLRISPEDTARVEAEIAAIDTFIAQSPDVAKDPARLAPDESEP